MIKTFSGKLADEDIETIRLSTSNGLIGYRIKDFRAIFENPAGLSAEAVLKVYTVKPETADAIINFDDPTLIGAIFIENNNSATYFGGQTIVFEHVTFNQDIYVTYEDNAAGHNCNYYLELEAMKLSDNEATVATLKEMRGRE